MTKTESRRHCIECNGYIRQQDFYDIKRNIRSNVCEPCERENWEWAFKVLNKIFRGRG